MTESRGIPATKLLPLGLAVLVVAVAGCGGGSDGDAGPTSGGKDAPSTSAPQAWCDGAAPVPALEGAGLSGVTVVTSFMVGEPGSEPTGVSCGYRTNELGFVNLSRLDLGDEAAAAEFVGQPADDTHTVDGFDAIHAGFIGDPALSEYRMLLQRGSEVLAARTASCPDEETCDEAFAAVLSTVARAEPVPEAEPCADDSGEEYRVLPLGDGSESEDDAFALVDGDGDVAYTATTAGIDTNVVFAMTGAPVDESAVQRSSGGEIVAVDGIPVLTTGDLDSIGYVLEKDWAISLDGDHSAVTTYEGEAEAPFVEGRFLVSESSPCVAADVLGEGEDRAAY